MNFRPTFPNHLFRLSPVVPIFLAALLPLALGGCHTTALHGKPFMNATPFKANPPRTLALLPTTDDSGHPSLTPMLRRSLFAAIAPLPYEDRELRAVDEFLATKATRAGVAPDKLPSEAMTDPQLADCVIYSRLERVSRLYMVFYAHYRFDLGLVMVDTRTRQVIYRNRFTFYDRLGSPAMVSLPVYSIYAFAGVAESSVESLLHLRSSRLEETFEEGAKKIAEELPTPELLGRSSTGEVRLTGVQVVKPFPVLGPGERVIVKAQATPGCQANFSVGKVARDVPMQENAPGAYFGIYEIKPGDNTDYAIVEVHLAKGADKLDYPADGESFAIDTAPPPRARVTATSTRFLRRGVFLKFELDPAAQASSSKDKDKPLEYHVYRKVPGKDKYERIGITHKLSYHDATARRGQTESYYVLTKDSAGNLSPVWDVKDVKVE